MEKVKSFFDEFGIHYNEAGKEFDDEARKILEPFLEKWSTAGYHKADMVDIIVGMSRLILSTLSIKRRIAMMKEREN